MGLQVVGAGLGRTGTMSLKLALEQLLDGRCYHMFETLTRPDDGPVWVAASQGQMPDWNAFLAEYNAAVDWPACDFWQQMSDANPEAIVLLSVRESADAWWKSANATIFQALRRMSEPSDEEHWQADFFMSRFATFTDEDAAMAYYDEHNARVRATARPDRFVEYVAGSGWEPLCAALGVPVPDAPFPHTNTREEFEARLAGTGLEDTDPAVNADSVRAMVDSALDRVFDEPFDIRSDTDFERILLEPGSTGRPGAAASALAGFVAMATPFAQRTLRIMRTGSKAPVPGVKAAKYAAIAVPIGVQLSSTVRRGIRELQALASFIIWRLRDDGIEPERSFVRALTLSLYIDADRRPDLDTPWRRVAASLTRVWIFRAIGTDSESHVFRRGQAWIAALDRLDLADLARRKDPPPQLLPA